MDERRNILVTLANKNYVQQVKQLFSSVYWNAGWKGDYMLLSHDIPEEDLIWFRNKGILIKECEPLHEKYIFAYHPVVLDKFYLFTEEFKKWKNVIFIDADVIVRAPLERLTQIEYFGAARDFKFSRLNSQFYDAKRLNLKNLYDFNEHIFNSGVMSINTDLITSDTFNELNILLNDIINEIKYPEQAVFNLYFYKKWERLSLVYNLFPMIHLYKLPFGLKGIILHFITDSGRCLWDTKHPFYKEWKMNLDKAEFIDLKKIQEVSEWNMYKIFYYSLLFKTLSIIPIRNIIHAYYIVHDKLRTFFYYMVYLPDRLLGKIGVFLKKNNPDLYRKLKKIKGGK